MRLTVEVLARCPQVTNALSQREVDLRGRALTLLDEGPLAQLADSFDVLNVSDNALTALESIPPMPRITAVIAHRNQLRKIHPTVTANLPNVDTFGADCNLFSSAVDLVRSLRSWKHLRRVTVDGNPVVAAPLAGATSDAKLLRSLLILACPKLVMINYERISDVERKDVAANAAQLRDMLRDSDASGSSAACGQEKTRKRGRAAAQTAATGQSQPATASATANDTATAEEDEAYTKALYARLYAAETEEELMAIQEELDAREQRRPKARRT